MFVNPMLSSVLLQNKPSTKFMYTLTKLTDTNILFPIGEYDFENITMFHPEEHEAYDNPKGFLVISNDETPIGRTSITCITGKVIVVTNARKLLLKDIRCEYLIILNCDDITVESGRIGWLYVIHTKVLNLKDLHYVNVLGVAKTGQFDSVDGDIICLATNSIDIHKPNVSFKKSSFICTDNKAWLITPKFIDAATQKFNTKLVDNLINTIQCVDDDDETDFSETRYLSNIMRHLIEPPVLWWLNPEMIPTFDTEREAAKHYMDYYAGVNMPYISLGSDDNVDESDDTDDTADNEDETTSSGWTLIPVKPIFPINKYKKFTSTCASEDTLIPNEIRHQSIKG